MKFLILQVFHILKQLKSPFFIFLTLAGNLIIFSFSLLFYILEKDHNSSVDNWLSAIWWAFATVTTVGYGDIVPATSWGRVAGILLMLIGTGLFATYTAFFVNTFFNRKSALEMASMRKTSKEIFQEEEKIFHTLKGIKDTLSAVDKKLSEKYESK